MAHSVEGHLHLQASEYDRVIRTFIPNYDGMLQEILYWLRTVVPENGKVIDLGGGTGSLANAVAESFPTMQLEIWDTDRAMLAALSRALPRARWSCF